MALHGEALQRPTYSFLRTISEGSNAICRLVEHEIFGRKMVQKTISLLGVPDGLARSEPRLLVDIDDDHLVRVREAQWDPEFPEQMKMVTFVTDYYEGQSIQTAQSEGYSFGLGQALKIAEHILEGLHCLHVGHRLIHRDVKPGNVMLDSSRSHARLGDLGSAAHFESDDPRVLAASGTLLYRPPEYRSGHLDARSDLFSTGMTLFELINGPFAYDKIDADDLVMRADQGRVTLPPRYFQYGPWVPKSVVGFTNKLLATDPARRFATAADALAALRRLDHVDWEAAGPGEWIGKYPPQTSRGTLRRYRVFVEYIAAGRYRGMWRLTAAWSGVGGPWRNYSNMARVVPADDIASLTTFFDEVDRRAQSAPTR